MQVDALTLDQVRLFVCVVEKGSFSAAARHLHRVQSAVSYGIDQLERNLELQLFDRSGRRPVLTRVGSELLADAREVLHAAHRLAARAAAMGDELELEVALVVSAICPASLLVELGRAFQEHYPQVALRVHTEVMEGVEAVVADGTCQLGISGPTDALNTNLERSFLTDISLVPVASPAFGVAGLGKPLARSQLENLVQIVISGRAHANSQKTRNVYSNKTWRVADAPTKHALIRAGLGWGFLPLALVEKDLEDGTLTQLHIKELGPASTLVPLSLVTRTDAPPGPAGRWLLEEIRRLCTGSVDP